MQKRLKENLFLLCAALASFLIIFMCIFAAFHNYGMEGDEVFSYISATSEGGFKKVCFLEDQTWYEAEYFRNALTATGKECFNIKMVAENQAMDSHPPLYYIFLNLICSFLEGKFSPWIGIGLNIFFLLFVGMGLFLLIDYFIKNKYLSLAMSTIFCGSYLAIEMTLFIRMYVLLMAFVLFESWYLLRLYDRLLVSEEMSVKKIRKTYGSMMLLTVAGALTHYYFLVYLCLISVLFVFGLFIHKKYRDIFRFIGTMALSGIFYIIIWPASLEHLFFKYRGREAVYKFIKGSTLFGEVTAMLRSFNERMFKGWLPLIIVTLTIVTVVLFVKKKIKSDCVKKGILYSLPALIYFFGISKASPFVTIRYISPVAAIIFTLVVVWAKVLIGKMCLDGKKKQFGYILLCLCMFMTCFYFQQKPVKEAYFLEEKKIVDRIIADDTDYCVYVTGDEYNWKMWENYVDYPEFKGLYFIDGLSRKPITDDKLLGQESLLIYVDTSLDLEEIKTYLQKYLNVSNYTVVYQTSYVYIVQAQA